MTTEPNNAGWTREQLKEVLRQIPKRRRKRIVGIESESFVFVLQDGKVVRKR